MELLFLLIILLPSAVSAYSWRFAKPPAQCQDLVVEIIGEGIPPYNVVILPFGPSPLPDAVAARRAMSLNSTGTNNRLTWKLNYPADSQFVVVVSDASGYGSGGTSAAIQIAQGTDDSCFDGAGSIFPLFTFSIEPENQIVQCSQVTLGWHPNMTVGTPRFTGVIPGGQSFRIPVPPATQLTSLSVGRIGFNWTATVRSGTTLAIVAGDDRGTGTGGSASNIVSYGSSPVTSCLNDNTPSSTLGTPPGWPYPTSTSSTPMPSSSSPSVIKAGKSVPAIIGAVVGGVASLLAFFLALLCYGRRIRRGKQRVDVIPDEDDGFYDRPGSSPFLQLQPYLIHTPSTFSISDHGRLSTSATNNSRQSSELAHLIPASPPASATSWRSGSGSGTPRPIDLILHDDAGPPSAPEELPPAYANLQNSGPYPQAAQVTSTKRWI